MNMFRVLLLWAMATAAVGTQFPTTLPTSVSYINYGAYTGTIPTQLGDLSMLTYLIVADGGHDLHGTIPTQIGFLTGLTFFYGYGASLTGTLPSEIGMMTVYTSSFLVHQNSLTGTIPTEISGMGSLNSPDQDYLYLYQNQLSGSLPTELGDSKVGYDWEWQSNKLSGEIPTELGRITDSGAQPYYWRLDYNSLCGDLPTEVSSISSAYGWYMVNQAGNGIGYACPTPTPTTGEPSALPTLMPTTSTLPTPLPTTEPSPVPTTPLPSPVPTTDPSPVPSSLPTTYDHREYLDRNADKKMLRKAKHIAKVEKRKAMKLAKKAEKTMS